MNRLLTALIVLTLWSPCAVYGEQITDSTGIRCVMGEARGETYEGMVAVGEALRNRGTTNGVYGCTAQFDEPTYVWIKATSAWKDSKHSNLVNGATHWESTDYRKPYWAMGMDEIAHIGKHKFYKERSK